jgi:hypothetical protein
MHGHNFTKTIRTSNKKLAPTQDLHYNRITKRLVFFHQSKKKFKSAIFESVSNAQKFSPSLQIWTIGYSISQLHVCQVLWLKDFPN